LQHGDRRGARELIDRHEEPVMAYALLIIETPGERQLRGEAQGRERYQRMVRFSEDLKDRGLLTASQSLTSDGVRVRIQGGAASVVDGPFSEAKEMIGGFVLLACESRDEAVTIARECPAAGWATVEVRELGPCFM
jgi:hypothetical protein